MIGYLLPLIAGLLSVVLGIIVLLSSATRPSIRVTFALFSGSVGAWAVFISLFLLSTNEQWAHIFVITYYIAALSIGYSFMAFGLVYSSVKLSRPFVLISCLSFLLMSLMIVLPNAFIRSIELGAVNTVELLIPSYALYSLLFIGCVAISFSALLRGSSHNHGRRTSSKSQHRILVVSLLVSIAGGGFFNLILPGLGDYTLIAWGPVFAFIMVSSVFYAITKHGLFDIKTAIIRSIAYALVLTTLAVIYYLLAYLVSVFIFGGEVSSGMSVSPMNVALALALAFLFQPIKKFFDRLTDDLFYKDNYSAGQFYDDLNALVRSTINLRALLSKSASLIKDTLKGETVSFFVFNDKSLVSVGTDKFRKMPIKDVREFEKIDDLVFVDSPDADPRIARMLISHRVSVAVPLRHNNILVGIMCIGEHQSSRYSRKDLQVFKTAAGELVVGIQNALSVQEVRDLNENLQQRVDAATKELRRSNAQLQRLDEVKDEFISMASHQLRTPLTSIKGYLSMMVDGDMGRVSPKQKDVLEEALTSSERMVRLIGDFLNVSRLQTGKFVIEKSPVDLAVLIGNEIDSLEQSAAGRGLKFRYKKPKKVPVISIDENKIQQVVMNFIDNAIYYSKEGDVITVTLSDLGDMLEFTVKDTGIGVPEEEQAGLFGKFFRASNARQQRPDGTGVGLFLAKKVVTDHGGEIIFSSREGKGSTFGFKLPVPKDYKAK